jgi:hypothetical protein
MTQPSATVVPTPIGIEQDGIPIFFETMYLGNFAGYAAELARRAISGWLRKRIVRIKDEIHSRVAGSREAPTIPLDMLKVSVCGYRLRQNLSLVRL